MDEDIMRNFSIATLSDCTTCQKIGDDPVDPVTIITAGVGLLSQLFPSWFGGGSIRLTSADWLKIIPSNGYWSTQLRNTLAASIKWNTDLGNIQEFTRYFLKDKAQQAICGTPNGGTYTEACLQKFYDVLSQESRQPGTNIPGVTYGVTDWQKYLPYIVLGGLGFIIIASKKKKSGRRK